jgi:hypothetical protein
VGATKPIEKSVDHYVRQNCPIRKEIIAKSDVPSTTLRLGQRNE